MKPLIKFPWQVLPKQDPHHGSSVAKSRPFQKNIMKNITVYGK